MLPLYPNAALRTLLVVNPAAGGGRARHAAPIVLDLLRSRAARVEVRESEGAEHLRRLGGEALREGFQSVLCLGGDGAFHHLVQSAAGLPLLLGLLPAGNGNDLARALGIPVDPAAAAELFLRTPPRSLDVLEVRFPNGHTELSAGVCGMGLDAEIAEIANGRFRRWSGLPRYLAGLGAAVLRHHSPIVKLAADESAWSGRCLLAVTANVAQYGAGFHIAPDAVPDDGWLNVVAVEDLPWTRLVEAVPKLLTTGHIAWPEVHRFRARRVRLEADPSALVHADGELIGRSPAEILLRARSLRMAAPLGPAAV